ncbi:MAG: hypothetical protein V7K47_00400 [Nostoc sp.]
MYSIETSLEPEFGSDGLELMSLILQISELEQLKKILRRIVVVNTIEGLENVLQNKAMVLQFISFDFKRSH